MTRPHRPAPPIDQTKRELLIGEAVAARKIAADRAGDYRRMYDAMPAEVEHLLTAPVESGGLMAGMIAPPTPAPFTPNAAGPTDYPQNWVPEVGSGRVTFEDQGTRAEAITSIPPRNPGNALDPLDLDGRNIPGVTFE
jgi:hypothetical protein